MSNIIGITEDHKPWSDDEITLRINMIRDMLNRHTELDNIAVIQLTRERETWKELLRRRHEGVLRV